MTSTRPGRQERGVRYASNDQDRLKRALLQPVQPWDKKWTALKNGRHLQVYKWVKSERQLVFDEDDDMDEDEEGIVPSGPSKEAAETPQDILTPLPTTPSNLPTTPSAPIPTVAPPTSALPSVEDLSTSTPSTHLTIPHTVASTSSSALDMGPPPLISIHTPGDDEERSHTPKLEDLSDVEEPEEERDAEADEDDGEDPVAAARRQGLVRLGEEAEDSSFGVTLRREEEEEEEELDDEDDDEEDDGDDEMLDEEMMDAAAAAAAAGRVGGFDAHDPSFDVAAGMMGSHAEMMRVELEGLGETPQSEGAVMGGEGLGELEEAELNFGGGTGSLDFGGLPPAPPPTQAIVGESGFGEGEDSQGEFGL